MGQTQSAVGTVRISLELVFPDKKSEFPVSRVYSERSYVEEGRHQRAVREAATKLLKTLRAEGVE